MTIIVDDFSPVSVGDTGAPFAPQFLHKDGSPQPLIGATITMIMEDAEGNTKNAAGTWVIDDPSNGQAHYLYDANDVNTAGNWILYITITIGGKPLTADTKSLEIKPKPAL